VAVAGFGGMRDHDGRLSFAPRLPPRITRLAFRVVFQGSCVAVTITSDRASYRQVDGDTPVELSHHGEALQVGAEPVERKIPPAPDVAPVRQPPHAAPRRRYRPESD